VQKKEKKVFGAPILVYHRKRKITFSKQRAIIGKNLSLSTQEAKYVESWPNTTSAGLAGADLILPLTGLMEYIPC
jgi:hypothetical protein